jgi:hypothetical protein
VFSLRFARSLVSNQNVIDWNVDKLDKESDETHDKETNAGSSGNLSKFLAIRLGALFDQMNRVLGKLLKGFNQNLVETLLIRHDTVGGVYACEYWDLYDTMHGSKQAKYN